MHVPFKIAFAILLVLPATVSASTQIISLSDDTVVSDEPSLGSLPKWGTHLPTAPVITALSSSELAIKNLQAASEIGNFGALLLSNGGNLLLDSGNVALLAGTVLSPSQAVFNGNISLSSGASLVLTAVPEPSHFSMLALGLLGVSFAVRHKTNNH